MILDRTPGGKVSARAYVKMGPTTANGPDAELDTPAGPTDQTTRRQVIG